jgi:hypothetical protein
MRCSTAPSTQREASGPMAGCRVRTSSRVVTAAAARGEGRDVSG